MRLNDVLEHIQRVLHHARRLEASAESAVQLHFSANTHQTNEIVRKLTAIAAIFAPLTLIAGVLGMNFEHMPLLHDFRRLLDRDRRHSARSRSSCCCTSGRAAS